MKYLVFSVLLILGISLEAQSSIRDRHGTVYPLIKMDNNDLWLGKNLSVKVSQSWCWNDKEEPSCKVEGRLYTLKSAKEACRTLGPGWELPGWDDWNRWRIIYQPKPAGKYDYNQQQMAYYFALAMGGKSKLELRFGGYRSGRGLSGYREGNVVGAYWSKYPDNPSQVITFNIHRRDRQFYEEIRSSQLGLSTRCIKKR